MSLIWTPDHFDRLMRLAETADRIVVGTAYLTANPFEAVLRRRASSVPVTVVAGLSGNTDQVVALALRDGGALVRLVPNGPVGGIFHAKVYGFVHGGEGTVVVGSGNLTGPAFLPDGNIEVFTVVPAEVAEVDELERKLLALGMVDDLDTLPEFAGRARGTDRGGGHAPRTPAGLMAMTWPQYLAALREQNRAWARFWGSRFGEGSSWFDTLARLNTLGDSPIGTMSASQRRVLAGAPIGEVNPGFFGDLHSAGTANGHLLRADDPSVLKVLDAARRSVGRVGEPLSIDAAMRAMEHVLALRGFGFAAASRLLGSVRPDVYVILNNASVAGVNTVLENPFPGIEWSAASQRRYRAVLEAVRAARWWNTPRPRGTEGFIWDGRALLLDTFFYDPAVG